VIATNWPLVVTEFLHVAGGAAWLGGSVFANLVLLPFIVRQPVERQRSLIAAFVLGPQRVMIAAALLAAITGFVRGIVFGPTTSLEALGSPYGLMWIVSIVIALAVYAVGGMVTSPSARRLRDLDGLWSDGEGATSSRTAAVGRLQLGSRLELVGIGLILALMAALPYVPR
jgi:uncharacterized membrane protein